MPRTARAVVGGLIYHALNRGNNRQAIFRKPGDFAAFVQLLIDGKKHADVQVLSYCLMKNHWHLVLIPKTAKDLARYLAWVSNTHVKRYRAHYPDTSGHLYQGRFKSFVTQDDTHLLTLLRYVEANPLRAHGARRVKRAQDWPWSSLGCDAKTAAALLSDWPIHRPRDWTTLVNRALPDDQLQTIRKSLERDRPLGGKEWVTRMCKQLGLEFTLRDRGRPKMER